MGPVALRCPLDALLREAEASSSPRHVRVRDVTGARCDSLPTECRTAASAANFAGDEVADADAALIARCCGLEVTDSKSDSESAEVDTSDHLEAASLLSALAVGLVGMRSVDAFLASHPGVSSRAEDGTELHRLSAATALATDGKRLKCTKVFFTVISKLLSILGQKEEEGLAST